MFTPAIRAMWLLRYQSAASPIESPGSTLALLVPRILLADHANHAVTLHDLAVATHAFY
jgi:hypothetical protein